MGQINRDFLFHNLLVSTKGLIYLAHRVVVRKSIFPGTRHSVNSAKKRKESFQSQKIVTLGRRGSLSNLYEYLGKENRVGDGSWSREKDNTFSYM